MIQINHGFKEYYYLKEDGTILNAASGTIIKPNAQHIFCLRADTGNRKIALKTLYKLLYNKNYCRDSIEDLNGEQWKAVEDTEGCYFVSNKGRIKSLQGYDAVILKPYYNRGGYARADIIIEGKRQSKLVHRLVAAAFLDLPEKIDMQLHHKDFDKKNNSADNLCWLTAAAHSKVHKQHNQKEGGNNGEAEQSTKSTRNNDK